jgi:hypothetical protein
MLKSFTFILIRQLRCSRWIVASSDFIIYAVHLISSSSIWENLRGYILKSADNVAEAREWVTESCMDGVGCKLWPQFVQHFHGYKGVNPSVNRDTLKLSQRRRMLKRCLHPMPKIWLMKIWYLLADNPEVGCGEKDDVIVPRKLTLKRMSLAISRIEERLCRLAENDPNKKLNSKGRRNLTLSNRCYYELCKEKEKQSSSH